jgi:hypothetical protein
VKRRVHQLAEPGRKALQLAAVAGRRFDYSLLAELLQVDDPVVLDIAGELMVPSDGALHAHLL